MLYKCKLIFNHQHVQDLHLFTCHQLRYAAVIVMVVYSSFMIFRLFGNGGTLQKKLLFSHCKTDQNQIGKVEAISNKLYEDRLKSS